MSLSNILLQAECLIDMVGTDRSPMGQNVAKYADNLKLLLRKREERGLQTYGQTLDTAVQYCWKRMLLEELADGLMYITKYAETHKAYKEVQSVAGLLIVLMAAIEKEFLYDRTEGGKYPDKEKENQEPGALHHQGGEGKGPGKRSLLILPG